MAHGLDLDDANAWDDSALVESWNDALAEYKKYHTIHVEGKKIEDVLTDEELAQLKLERGSLQKSANGIEQEPVEETTQEDADMELSEEEAEATTGFDPNGHLVAEKSKQETTKHQAHASSATSAFKPQAVMNGVQDEGLKNIMMSWYYAGYYMGLHEGEKKAREE